MYIHMYVKKAAETTFIRNIRTFNVDEIDTYLLCQRPRTSKERFLRRLPKLQSSKQSFNIGMD